MAKSAALIVLPLGRHGDEDGNASQTDASLLAQCLMDLRLAERVEQALGATGYFALRAVEVLVCDQCVFLEGRVHSYYLKQRAQAVAMEVAGVRELRNEVQVFRR
jgi:osmotically-inducible protein OsmY